MVTTWVELQERLQQKANFASLEDYSVFSLSCLQQLAQMNLTRIVSPSHHNYIFFQFDANYQYRITRPLNSHLFIESPDLFTAAYERFRVFLDDLRLHHQGLVQVAYYDSYLASQSVSSIIYTMQQTISCLSDSLDNPNQSRKLVGQLFERLIALVVQEIGLECQPRTIVVPIPGYPGHKMSYELDIVFSREKVIITSESAFIHLAEIVGSIKTTSKDRIDKVFLDKYLLSKLLGRDVPVVAIFLHDVQRATRGNNNFAINSTFKSNHFLGYSVALNKLDGVYYVDPRPEMVTNSRLREQIFDFQRFLLHDIWVLSAEG